MSRSVVRHRRLPSGRVSTPGNTYDELVLGDNPEGYWTLDGTSAGLIDRANNGHNATNHGATAASWLNGGGAFAFNGVGNYIEVPDHPRLSVTATGVLTLELWMSPAVLTFPDAQGKETDDYIHFAGKLHGQAEYAARMYQFAPITEPDRSNMISGYVFNIGGSEGAGSRFQDPIVAGSWIHYVLVINSVNTSSAYTMGYTKIYRDGVLRDQDRLSDYNVIPQNGTAPLRFGTTSFDSYLQGRLAKAAVYNYELSQAQIREHYDNATTVGGGGGSTATGRFLRHVGNVSSTTSSDRVQIVVAEPGVAVGSTLLARASTEFTTSHSCIDSRGNTWAADRTGVDSGNTVRGSIFRCQVQVPLRAGDIIELRTAAAVSAKAFAVDEFDRLLFVAANTSNAAAGTSTSPSTTTPTSTAADAIVYGIVATNGPTSDAFTADTGNSMVALTRTGTNTDVSDATVNGAYRAVTTTGAFSFSPTLGTSRTWVDQVAVYAAGTPVLNPPTPGSASRVKNLVSGTSSSAGTTLVLTVPGPDAIPVGSTLVMTVSADYTATEPTVTTTGNTWSVNRTAPNAANTIRAAMFSCPVTTTIAVGATITVTFPTTITRKVASVVWYAGLLVPTAVNAQTGATGTSGSPSTTLTTSVTDTLLVAAVAMGGPSNAAYTPDAAWVNLPTVGTSGSGSADRALYSAFRVVHPAAGYPFAPLLQGSYPWVELLVAYRAGTTTPPPPPSGTAGFVRTLDEETATASGTTLSLTVPSGGVAVGNTPILALTGDYTATPPTVTDSRSNVWTAARTGQNGIIRTSIYTCAMTTRLQAADTITVTWPSAITRRAAVASEYTGLLGPVTVDTVNSKGGTSAAPNVTVTTANADDLIVSAVGFAAPLATTYTEHTAGLWTGTSRVGTTGGGTDADRSLAVAYRSVDAAGPYTHAPTLGTSAGWISVAVSYRAEGSAPPASYDAMVLADSPRAYWTLDGTTDGLVDLTGNGHNATAFNSPTQGTWVDGSSGAVTFNGTTQYLEVPDHNALSINYTGIFSFELWINPATLNFPVREGSGAGYVHLAGKGKYQRDEYVIRIFPQGDEKGLDGMLFGYAMNITGGEGTGSRTRAVAPGEWVHFVFITDTTKTNAEYPSTTYPGFTRTILNGIVQDVDQLDGIYHVIPQNGTDPLRFGTCSATTSSDPSYFPGKLAHAAIYNRALTPAEAMARYRAKVPLVNGAGGLVRSLGTSQASASGTTMTLTVPSGGVATGNTPVVSAYSDYISSPPTCTDSRGNTWVRDRSVAPSDGADANVARLSIFRCNMATRLQAGDTITVTWGTSTAHRVIAGAEISGIISPIVLDASNSGTVKSINDPICQTTWPFGDLVTATARTIIVSALGMNTAATNIVGVDDPDAWKPAGQVGTTGGSAGADRSLLMGVRSVTTVGSYRFGGTLSTPALWASASCAYRAT